MRKSIFILIFLISFLLLSSTVSAQFVPLDIISNFFNNILKSLGLTATATTQKTIPSSGTIIYPTECDSRCKAQGYYSGVCSNTPPSGFLHTSGTKIFDETDKEIVLIGTYFDYNAAFRHDSANPNDVRWFELDDVKKIKSYGGNVIETNEFFLSDILSSKGIYNQALFNRLDEILSWCQQEKVYYIINFVKLDNPSTTPSWFFDGYGSIDQTNAWKLSIDFWNLSSPKGESNRQEFLNLVKYIGNRYKDNPYFIFHIFDEPFAGNNLVNSANAKSLSINYARFVEQIIDTIRSAGYKEIVIVDKPYVWYYTNHYEPVNRDNIAWDDHAYATPKVSMDEWKTTVTNYAQQYAYTFNKPFTLAWGVYTPTSLSNWRDVLQQELLHIWSLPISGYKWFQYPWLEGEWYDRAYNELNTDDSDYILNTIFTYCQPGQTSIGQDGCSSGETCCCS